MAGLLELVTGDDDVPNLRPSGNRKKKRAARIVLVLFGAGAGVGVGSASVVPMIAKHFGVATSAEIGELKAKIEAGVKQQQVSDGVDAENMKAVKERLTAIEASATKVSASLTKIERQLARRLRAAETP